jgi:hypothetical protein
MKRWGVVALISISVVGFPLFRFLKRDFDVLLDVVREGCMRGQAPGFCVVINPKKDYSIRHYVLCFLILGALLIVASSRLQAEQDSTSRTLAGLSIKRDLQPTKAMFEEMDLCRQGMPAGALKQRFTQVEESLAVGLMIGWRPGWLKEAPEPHYTTMQSALAERANMERDAKPLTAPPELYLQSLQNDAHVCRAAIEGKLDSNDIVRVLARVVSDLDLKFRDCYLHGMGRLINVSVTTDKGTVPDGGWTVYFKWMSVSDIPTTESTFPSLSTPAKDDLPPGIYQFRADKKDPKSAAILNSETKTVNLDGTNSDCELQVP